jgi:CDP-diacylglycerol--serine O-phosphatidyltransferase
MVSDIEYPSFKSVNWRTRRSLSVVIVTILVVWFSVNNWQWTPAVFFVSYLLYGLVRPWVSRRMRQQIEIEHEEPEEERGVGDGSQEAASEEAAKARSGL